MTHQTKSRASEKISQKILLSSRYGGGGGGGGGRGRGGGPGGLGTPPSFVKDRIPIPQLSPWDWSGPSTLIDSQESFPQRTNTIKKPRRGAVGAHNGAESGFRRS